MVEELWGYGFKEPTRSVEERAVEAVLGGGERLRSGLFMAKQECLCAPACLVCSGNTEHLQRLCWDQVGVLSGGGKREQRSHFVEIQLEDVGVRRLKHTNSPPLSIQSSTCSNLNPARKTADSST